MAQRAVVECIHRFVGHVGQTLVAELVCHAGFFQPFGVQVGVGDDLDLHLVHDSAKIGVEAGIEDLAKVLEVESLFVSHFADPDPGDVTLTDVLYAGCAVDEIVHLPLQHRFKVLLHLAPGHLDDERHIHGGADLFIVNAGADDLDFVVFHLFHR